MVRLGRGRGDGKVRNEGLVDEGRSGETRGEGDGEGRGGGFDEVRVDVFRLVAIF